MTIPRVNKIHLNTTLLTVFFTFTKLFLFIGLGGDFVSFFLSFPVFYCSFPLIEKPINPKHYWNLWNPVYLSVPRKHGCTKNLCENKKFRYFCSSPASFLCLWMWEGVSLCELTVGIWLKEGLDLECSFPKVGKKITSKDTRVWVTALPFVQVQVLQLLNLGIFSV